MESRQELKCSVCAGYLAPANIVQSDRIIERVDSCIATVKKSQPIQAYLHGNSEYPLALYVCNGCGLAYFFKEQ